MNSCNSAKYIFYYINNSTTNEISKNILTVVRIVKHNAGTNGDIHRNLKYCIQNFKNSLRNMKIENQHIL